MRARTGLRVACVSNGVARYTPDSTENFLIPHLGEQKKKCVFHKHIEIENILKTKEEWAWY